MPRREDSDDYRRLFLSDTPMMDMRAPVEFSQGAFPSAYSLPLMTDDERAAVGTCYKRHGQQAAIELGHKLVSGDLKAERLTQWSDFARSHPDGYLYCFRGGLRSQTVRQWLAEAGIDYPLIKGGYKAMRRFLIDELERSLSSVDIVLIAGKTGTGKTKVIEKLSNSVDLEGLANHRGSTFGHLPEPQPSQIDFENALSIALLKQLAQGEKQLFLEDEGRLIGSLSLPEVLRDKMATASMLVVEHNLQQRVDLVLQDYIVDLGARYHVAYGEQGAALHAEQLLQGLFKIRKRLGLERYQSMQALMTQAFADQAATGDIERHRQWIAFLLESYYDPMYDYQFSQREGRVLYRADRSQVLSQAQELAL